MRYDAAIFDLFGTLIDTGRQEDYAAYYERHATALGLTIDDLRRALDGTLDGRDTGRNGSLAGDLERVYTFLGRTPMPDRIEQAIAVRLEFYGRALEPRDGAIDMLTRLRSAGLKTALLSDCGWDIPMLWARSQFVGLLDAVGFSCVAGVHKPDPTAYRAVCERIGVAPERCLFVGDGGSRELTGALAVGMQPVCIRVGYEDYMDVWRPNAVEWTGPVIRHLSEVPELVGLP